MTPNESPRAANTGALNSQCQVVVSSQGTPESTVTSAATVIAAVNQDDYYAATQERIAHLNPQWRWVIRKTATLGWEVFPLNDRVRTAPGWEGEDWSKRPRRRCTACKAPGRRVPRSQRRHWVTSITRFRTGVCRAYACDEHVVSIQIILPNPAGVL